MPLYFFYTRMQKSKTDQKLKSKGGGGGSCLKLSQKSIFRQQPQAQERFLNSRQDLHNQRVLPAASIGDHETPADL